MLVQVGLRRRELIFEPKRNLEHKGLILPFTLNTFNGGIFYIQMINMIDKDQFLSACAQLSTICDASVDL